jgi:ParB-like chromosome segregation protein Spo0J
MAVEFNTWKKAVEIPTNRLVFTDWNCNEMTEHMLDHLMTEIENKEDPGEHHFDEPLQVIPMTDSPGKYLVIGGEHRTKIARSLDMEAVPCVIREDLAKLSRKDLMLWSVRRNNLRGRLNATKYAEMEAELIDHHGMTAEAARRSMLVDGDLAKALRASVAVRDNEESTSDDGHDGTRQHGDTVDEAKDARRSKEELLTALKIAEQDVLLDSADTVEHGYLFFVQGKKGQSHLVVNESLTLHGLVKQMVAACKGVDGKVDDFLSGAIRNELKNWE